jgi:RNA polymerase sigma factor for flagellar operon FliA
MAASHTINLEEYYGLVIYKARKTHNKIPEAVRNKIELDDLIQEGLVGLIKAAERYNPEREASFATFSNFHIQGALKDYLRMQDPLSQKQRAEVKALVRAEKELSRRSNGKPSVAELSKSLGVSEDEVINWQRHKKIFISLDDGYERNERGMTEEIKDLPAVENPDPREEIAKKELWQDVDDCLKNTLEDYERVVLSFRTVGELTIRKTARVLNLHMNKVHRLEKKAGSKMKLCLEDKGWTVTDILEIYTK